MSSAAPSGRRIDSWKEIAAFFGRDERTVRRWEKERALPVHRVPGERGGVFAYTDELTRWLNSSGEPGGDSEAASVADPPLAESDPAVALAAAPESRRRWWAAPLVLTLAVLLVLAVYGYRHRSAAHMGRLGTAARHQPDPDAEEFYLKGRYDWNRRTEGSLKDAVDAFTQAVVHDPAYAQAYAGLAECYDIMPEFTSTPRAEAFPRAIAAASKAVALDDSLGEAHRALAFALFYWQWDIPRAFAEYRRALAIDPRDEEAHHWYATSLLAIHRYPEALAEIQQARKLNPTSRSILSDGALIRYWNGNHEAALEALREIERKEPDFVSAPRYLANLAFAQKDYRAYVQQTRVVAALTHDPQYTDLADAAERGLNRGGERGMLLALRPVQTHYFEQGKLSGVDLARTCAMLGEKDEAVRYLRAAVQDRDYLVFNAPFDPEFASLRDHPGFQEIRRQILAYVNS